MCKSCLAMFTFRDTFTTSRFGFERGNLSFANNVFLSYKLSCCGDFGLFFSFKGQTKLLAFMFFVGVFK